MKTLSQIRQENPEDSFYGDCAFISEAIHESLQSIIDSDSIPPRHKMNLFVKTARKMIKDNISTGLENATPKKGSSRAVFFPDKPNEVTIDGVKTQVPSAIKIAFSGYFDPHTRDKSLLGEHQNRVESDWYSRHKHGVLHGEKGEYHYNPEGVLAPVLNTHPDHHYVEFGKIEKVNAKNIREATTTPEFPKGLTHEQIYDATNHSYLEAHGDGNLYNPAIKSKFNDTREKTKNHPFVSRLIDFIHDTENHPIDYSKGNMGIWTHPVTQKKHLVITDYGFDKGIAKMYKNARKNRAEEMQQRFDRAKFGI